MQYATTDIARACNVTVNTVRNWCKDYSAFLSPLATVTGESRLFTERDRAVLEYIARLRAEGMQKGAIMQRLGETSFPDHGEELQEPNMLEVQPALQESPSAVPAPLVARDDLETRLALLERSVIETQRAQRPNVWWFAVGLLAGLGFAAIAELFALVAKR